MRTDGQADGLEGPDIRFSKFCESAKNLVFVLCHRYSPFYTKGPKICSISCFRGTMRTCKCDA
jgi:hypothetical protein